MLESHGHTALVYETLPDEFDLDLIGTVVGEAGQ